MPVYVNDAGIWKECREIWVNDAGTWKQCREVYANNGLWRKVHALHRYLRLTFTNISNQPIVREISYRKNGVDYPAQAMTGYNSPSPLSVSTSSDAAGNEAWRAFDDDDASWWFANGGAFVSGDWITIDLGAGNELRAEQIVFSTVGVSDVGLKVEGSNDGSSWDDLGAFYNVNGEFGAVLDLTPV